MLNVSLNLLSNPTAFVISLGFLAFGIAAVIKEFKS